MNQQIQIKKIINSNPNNNANLVDSLPTDSIVITEKKIANPLPHTRLDNFLQKVCVGILHTTLSDAALATKKAFYLDAFPKEYLEKTTVYSRPKAASYGILSYTDL